MQTWQSVRATFSLSVLANPIEASKGDAEMASGAMGTMHSKFASDAAAYSYLIFVLLYVPCVSVMGAIARESSARWMLFSVVWGIDLAYSLSALFYQLARFDQHPRSSLLIIASVILINALLLLVLRRIRIRPGLIPVKNGVSGCSGCAKSDNCH